MKNLHNKFLGGKKKEISSQIMRMILCKGNEKIVTGFKADVCYRPVTSVRVKLNLNVSYSFYLSDKYSGS